MRRIPAAWMIALAFVGAWVEDARRAAAQTEAPADARRGAAERRQAARDPARDHWRVPPLPADNLLQNPWFEDTLAPWVGDGHWQGDTTKWGNPAPHDRPGAAARISTGRRVDSDVGKTVDIGQDAYLYQVTAADPAHTTLKFDMYWVTHTVKPGEVNVYGGPSPQGPWKQVWRPFYQVHTKPLLPPQGRSGNVLWRHYSALTEMATTTLPAGYPYYKVEVHANLPDRRGGFKITGVYFAAVPADAPAPGDSPKQDR